MKEIRKYKNQPILNAIKDLEYLRVALGKIGRLKLENENDLDKFLLTENLFIHQSNIARKLSNIWRMLIDNYLEEENELDEELEVVEMWKVPYDLSVSELKDELKRYLDSPGSG